MTDTDTPKTDTPETGTPETDTPKTGTPKNRTYLVLVDESEELHQALLFACLRARRTGGNISLLYVIAPAEFAHWAGVGELMREEARAEAEEKMRVHSEYVQQLTSRMPVLHIREGEIAEQIIGMIDDDPCIALLVLGVDTHSDTVGPIITYLAGRGAARCRVPIAIVPGNLSDEQIENLT